MQWLQGYDFLYIGTLCDASKQIFYRSIVCNYCKNTVFHIFGPSLMNQIKFSLEVANAGYYFLHVGIFCDESKLIYFGGDKCSDCKDTIFCLFGTLCDASKRIFFWSIVCNHCKNTVYCFLDVATLCDASRQIFFSSIVCSICKSTISFILWCIKTHFVLEFMNAVILQDYCFLPDGTLCDASKRFFLK